jgi:hypothetical protein
MPLQFTNLNSVMIFAWRDSENQENLSQDGRRPG